MEDDPLSEVDSRIIRIKDNTFTENFSGSNSAVVDLYNLGLTIMNGNTFTLNGFVYDEAYEKYSALHKHQPTDPFEPDLALNQFLSTTGRKTQFQNLIDNVNWEDGSDIIDYFSPNVNNCLS